MVKNRLEQIITLLEQCDIETQDELTQLLKDSGYSVTQATVSRDIKKLGLVKVPSLNGKQKYALPSGIHVDLSEKFVRVLKDSFISMELAMNLLVIKTVSGMAMAAAAALDSMNMKEMVGAVAGDDTIMIAARSIEDAEAMKEHISDIVM
ncbi:MAG: arginine repressor [Lachnospiraceae bacterium]